MLFNFLNDDGDGFFFGGGGYKFILHIRISLKVYFTSMAIYMTV